MGRNADGGVGGPCSTSACMCRVSAWDRPARWAHPEATLHSRIRPVHVVAAGIRAPQFIRAVSGMARPWRAYALLPVRGLCGTSDREHPEHAAREAAKKVTRTRRAGMALLGRRAKWEEQDVCLDLRRSSAATCRQR